MGNHAEETPQVIPENVQSSANRAPLERQPDAEADHLIIGRVFREDAAEIHENRHPGIETIFHTRADMRELSHGVFHPPFSAQKRGNF
jgi:hypothetical protein